MLNKKRAAEGRIPGQQTEKEKPGHGMRSVCTVLLRITNGVRPFFEKCEHDPGGPFQGPKTVSIAALPQGKTGPDSEEGARHAFARQRVEGRGLLERRTENPGHGGDESGRDLFLFQSLEDGGCNRSGRQISAVLPRRDAAGRRAEPLREALMPRAARGGRGRRRVTVRTRPFAPSPSP